MLIATGVAWSRLTAARAEQFESQGLFYGSALAAAAAAQDRDVHVIGGANSAGQAAVFLADIAHTVIIVLRGSSFEAKMSSCLVRQLSDLPNVTVLRNSEVTALHGDGQLTAVSLNDRSSGRTEIVPSAAVFSFIGARPDTAWLPAPLHRDPHGFIVTNDPSVGAGRAYETNLPGVFAVGDVRAGSTGSAAESARARRACLPSTPSSRAGTRPRPRRCQHPNRAARCARQNRRAAPRRNVHSRDPRGHHRALTRPRGTGARTAEPHTREGTPHALSRDQQVHRILRGERSGRRHGRRDRQRTPPVRRGCHPPGLHGPHLHHAYSLLDAPDETTARAHLATYPQVQSGKSTYDVLPPIGLPAIQQSNDAHDQPLPAWWPAD